MVFGNMRSFFKFYLLNSFQMFIASFIKFSIDSTVCFLMVVDIMKRVGHDHIQNYCREAADKMAG